MSNYKITFEYSFYKPVEGQLQTAKTPKGYMDKGKHAKAIELFSKKKTSIIKNIRENSSILNEME